METNTYLTSPETEETYIIIPIEDMGSGEESLIVRVQENGIKFEVLDDEDNVLYQVSDSYEDFCEYVEARDLYLDAAVRRHPASQPTLQLIDGGGKEK
jgi:hypothetical protein